MGFLFGCFSLLVSPLSCRLFCCNADALFNAARGDANGSPRGQTGQGAQPAGARRRKEAKRSKGSSVVAGARAAGRAARAGAPSCSHTALVRNKSTGGCKATPRWRDAPPVCAPQCAANSCIEAHLFVYPRIAKLGRPVDKLGRQLTHHHHSHMSSRAGRAGRETLTSSAP